MPGLFVVLSVLAVAAMAMASTGASPRTLAMKAGETWKISVRSTGPIALDGIVSALETAYGTIQSSASDGDTFTFVVKVLVDTPITVNSPVTVGPNTLTIVDATRNMA